jgi:MFS transporter, PAT family, beta-lactamase induction signal transducer AmpG
MNKKERSGWWWVPSLYYAEGIPYNVAMIVSVVMYKTMGVSNSAIAFWTSILYLPWMIKPIWSPFIDVFSTKRKWIIWTQLALGITFFGVAATIGLPWYFPVTIAILWVVAFASATHDIAADGFYMLGLNDHKQAWFVGIRSTFYRFATITAMGLLVMLAGFIEANTGLEPVKVSVKAVPESVMNPAFDIDSLDLTAQSGDPKVLIFPTDIQIPLDTKRDSVTLFVVLSAPPQENQNVVVNFGRKSGSKDISLEGPSRFEFNTQNWNIPVKTFVKADPRLKEAAEANFEATAGDIPFSWAVSFTLLGFMLIGFGIYHKFVLPHPVDAASGKTDTVFSSYKDVFITFFRKEGIIPGILFLLLYRLAESQLVKLASPFLLDSQEVGGLALTTAQVGFVYGTIGIVALLLGGLIGGFLAARHGLKKWIWWMAIGINLPDLVYVFLSYVLPDGLFIVTVCVAIEQFGYGFGFTGYLLYMIYLSEGKYKTSHYALTTAFMAFGMMIPGMISGYIQEFLGYQHFFVWVVIATIPSFAVLKFIKLDPEFGMKKEKA